LGEENTFLGRKDVCFYFFFSAEFEAEIGGWGMIGDPVFNYISQ